MDTKMPLISYVVTTQYIINSAGLKVLYKKVFTNENILKARMQAMRYYEAAIEVLESMGEIITDQSTNTIIYKHPENYEQGISMEMRLNHDIKKSGIADKAGTYFKIKAHYNRTPSQNRCFEFGRKSEKTFLKLLKAFPEEKSVTEPFSGRRLVASAEIQKLRNKTPEEIEFIDFKIPKEDIELLLESICAFLNTNGGIIILGQSREMNDQSHSRMYDMEYVIKQLLKSAFHEKDSNINVQQKNLNNICFLEINITKSETKTLYNSECYYRNCIGNVLDFDNSEI